MISQYCFLEKKANIIVFETTSMKIPWDYQAPYSISDGNSHYNSTVTRFSLCLILTCLVLTNCAEQELWRLLLLLILIVAVTIVLLKNHFVRWVLQHWQILDSWHLLHSSFTSMLCSLFLYFIKCWCIPNCMDSF